MLTGHVLLRGGVYQMTLCYQFSIGEGRGLNVQVIEGDEIFVDWKTLLKNLCSPYPYDNKIFVLRFDPEPEIITSYLIDVYKTFERQAEQDELSDSTKEIFNWLLNIKNQCRNIRDVYIRQYPRSTERSNDYIETLLFKNKQWQLRFNAGEHLGKVQVDGLITFQTTPPSAWFTVNFNRATAIQQGMCGFVWRNDLNDLDAFKRMFSIQWHNPDSMDAVYDIAAIGHPIRLPSRA